jgi:hypothetical protein
MQVRLSECYTPMQQCLAEFQGSLRCGTCLCGYSVRVQSACSLLFPTVRQSAPVMRDTMLILMCHGPESPPMLQWCCRTWTMSNLDQVVRPTQLCSTLYQPCAAIMRRYHAPLKCVIMLAAVYCMCCSARAGGLLFANIAVVLSNMGQPALLYLVPTTLGLLCFIARIDGTLMDLWRGPSNMSDEDEPYKKSSDDGQVSKHNL